MQSSPEINEIAGALALAQASMSFAAKDSTNPHFKSKYADLASVVDAVRPHLAAQGIAMVQIPSCADGRVSVETRLLHKSGQWIGDGGGAWAACRDMSPQSVGSAETYGRRYGLMALCGIAPADDDGEAAQGRPMPQRQPERQERPTSPPSAPLAPKAELPAQTTDAVHMADVRAIYKDTATRLNNRSRAAAVIVRFCDTNPDGSLISVPTLQNVRCDLADALKALT